MRSRIWLRLRIRWRRWRRRKHGDLGAGVLYSLAVHGLAIALLLSIHPQPVVVPAEAAPSLIVELVQPGEGMDGRGVPADAKPAAPLPQPHVSGTPRKGSDAPDNVGDLLRMAETAHGSVAFAPPNGEIGAPQVGAGAPGSLDGKTGHGGLKDFIRAQIERRWEFDLAGDAPAIVVSLHLVLDSDGTVHTAEVVDDPKHAADKNYLAAAMGARNAALLSSPLQLPPGLPERFLDLTVDLNTKDALR